MQLVISTTLVIAGWLVNQWFARRAVRRSTRIEYLLSAYRRLEGSSNRGVLTVEHRRDMESAFADIQLLGSARQVEISTRLVGDFARSQEVTWDELLNDLRSSLRRELLLEQTVGNRKFLRFGEPADKKPEARSLPRAAGGDE